MGQLVSLTGARGLPQALVSNDFRLNICPSEEWIVPPPRSVVGGQFEIKNEIFNGIASARVVVSAPIHVSVIHNALVAPSGVVFNSAGDLVYETLFPWQKENFLTQFDKHIGEKNSEFFPKIQIDEVCDIEDLFHAREGGEVGYFHFINSIIPRLAIYKRIFSSSEIPILVNARKKFASDFLGILGVSCELPWGNWYRVKRLFLPSPMTFEGDHFFRPPFGSKLIRETLSSVKFSSANDRKIYLSREDSSVRKLQFEREAVKVLKEHGFEEYVVGNSRLEEQIEIFSSTKYLVSPHGAGLSNIIFLPKDASVLEILSPQRLWPTFRLLAARHDINYHALIGCSYVCDETETLGAGNESFSVDLSDLRRSVSQLLLS